MYAVRRAAAGRGVTMMPHRRLVLPLAVVLLGAAGCTSLSSPMAQDQLRMISAGHTGCMPEENVLTNVVARGSDATWNATCKGKTYLCSAVAAGSNSSSFSCAPVPQ
jgi:hypothetical protein